MLEFYNHPNATDRSDGIFDQSFGHSKGGEVVRQAEYGRQVVDRYTAANGEN
jgi:hypothetical protein